jgi:hypothetical protein
LVMVVCPEDYPAMSAWADRLRAAANIVEIKASEFCPKGKAFVMPHPDDYVPEIPYRTSGHHFLPPAPPKKVKLTDLTGY